MTEEEDGVEFIFEPDWLRLNQAYTSMAMEDDAALPSLPSLSDQKPYNCNRTRIRVCGDIFSYN